MDIGARPEMVWILLQQTLIFLKINKQRQPMRKNVKNTIKIEQHEWA